MTAYSPRGRTRDASTSCTYTEPGPVVYLTDAFQGPPGVQRTQRDCQPGHQSPSRFTSTGRGGSNTRRSSSSTPGRLP